MFSRRPSIPRFRHALALAGLVALGLNLSAAASEAIDATTADVYPRLKTTDHFLKADLAAATRTLDYAMSLLGSPYKRGGSDPKTGTDCSGFVRHVYQHSNGIPLPHNAAQMSERGEPVKQEGLLPGDLVFFNTLRRPFSHVGIYVGNGEFVHAASSRNRRVMVSRLDERYWRERYDGARRLDQADLADADLAPR